MAQTVYEDVMSICHPLCDKKKITYQKYPSLLQHSQYVLALYNYIEKKYETLFHYKGCVYPITTFVMRSDVSYEQLFLEKNKVILHFIYLLKVIKKLLSIDVEFHIKDKVVRLKEAESRTYFFFLNVANRFVFDLSPQIFNLIPKHLTDQMVRNYMKNRLPVILAGDIIDRKRKNIMVFSNFADINILSRYTMFLHGRLKNKEKAKEDFMKKMTNQDPLNLNFIRETKLLYYSLYPGQKKVVVSTRELLKSTTTIPKNPDISVSLPRNVIATIVQQSESEKTSKPPRSKNEGAKVVLPKDNLKDKLTVTLGTLGTQSVTAKPSCEETASVQAADKHEPLTVLSEVSNRAKRCFDDEFTSVCDRAKRRRR